MKIVLFNDYQLGLLRGDEVVDVSAEVQSVARPTPQLTLEGLITNFHELKPALQKALDSSAGIPLASVKLRPPVPRPGKIVAMGGNFGEGVGKKGAMWGFLKSPDAVIGPDDTVVLPNHDANIFHHEAELVAVMGHTVKNVKKEDALKAVFGYTCGVDVSGRFPPSARQQFAKSFDTFAPIGPCIATWDEIPNPHDLRVRFWVDGQPRHDYPMNDIAHSIEESIEWMTTIVTLQPGDLFFLGTNHQGIGPLQDGEHAEIEIEPIGRFGFNVSDPQKRRWPVGIDQNSADDVRLGNGGPGMRARPLA
jgi:2-keto-4-pentenoate hydratase/2-oxohepta-3-ene-1,7-dioic acid hydratase in catechol pathway